MSKNTKIKEEVKYGDKLVIIRGFFKGQVGTAIDFDEGTPEIYTKFGIEGLEEDPSYRIKLDDSGAKHWFSYKDVKIKKESENKPTGKKILGR